jgi:ribosome biogenesis GTPase
VAEGRVVKAVGGFYFVEDGGVLRRCRARGIFRKKGTTLLVGDYVIYQPTGNDEGVVEEVLPRTSALARPPVANVDQVMLTFATRDPAANAKLLDRLTVLVEHAGLQAFLCFTKADLIADAGEWRTGWEFYTRMGYPVVVSSAYRGDGLEEVAGRLRGRVTVLAGQSGVGKSTLLNTIYPGLNLKMGAISAKLGSGKHTTRHVELLRVEAGTYVADTPGFSQLDLTGIEPETLGTYFRDFAGYRLSCQFRGCLHEQEPGCAVREAAERGAIAQHRYAHYLQFLAELKEAKLRRY